MPLEEIEAKWAAACENYNYWINYNHPTLGVNNIAIRAADEDMRYWHARLVEVRFPK